MAGLVRIAGVADAPSMAAINPAIPAELVERHPGLVYLAEADCSVVGYLALKNEAHPAVDSRRPLQLWQIYVVAAFHGTGIAVELMTTVFEHARRHSHDVVWLGVSEHNERAIAFYRKHGFTPLGLHMVGAGHHEHEDILMTCPVS